MLSGKRGAVGVFSMRNPLVIGVKKRESSQRLCPISCIVRLEKRGGWPSILSAKSQSKNTDGIKGNPNSGISSERERPDCVDILTCMPFLAIDRLSTGRDERKQKKRLENLSLYVMYLSVSPFKGAR